MHKGDTSWWRESLKGFPSPGPTCPASNASPGFQKKKQIPQELEARAGCPLDSWANPGGDGCVLVCLTGSAEGHSLTVSFTSGDVDRKNAGLTLFCFLWLENVFILSHISTIKFTILTI